MKLNNFGDYLQAFSNLAVLIGIAALIYELNQNNVIARAQIRSDILRSSISSISMGQTPEALAIMRKLYSGAELDAAEEQWMELGHRREFRTWENVHYQYRIGLFDESEMSLYRAFWSFRADSCNSRYSSSYQRMRLQFTVEFRDEMDKYFSLAVCD